MATYTKQYTEGDTSATIKGTAAMMEVAANTLQPVQGTVADGLLVNLGTNNDVTVTSGTVSVTQTTDPWLVAGKGTAGSPGTAVLTIQGIGGGTAVPISGTVSLSSSVVDTELPAAASLGDATANPSTTSVGALNLLFNGTTWDRIRGDISNGIDVDVTRMAALVAGTAVIGKVGIDQTTPGTTNLVALSAETTKVIGVVRTADGSGNLLTSTTNALDVNLKTSSITLNVNATTVATHAVTVASGGIASGAIASGAIASGAIASGAFAAGSIVAGAIAAGASSFVKLEDAASADADAGVPAMAVRKATPANTSGTDGDYEMLQISAGRLWVDASGVTLTVSGTVTATPGATTAGTPAGSTVSTSAVLLKASNANRKAIVITNNGTGTLYIGHTSGVTSSGAAMGLGVPSGGSYSDSGFGLYTGDLYGIYSATAASQNVSVSERT